MDNREIEFIAYDSKKQKEINLLVRELRNMGHSDENINIIG